MFRIKNPGPMMDRLDELKDYQYYFQFTLTGYGKNIENNAPHKRELKALKVQENREAVRRNRALYDENSPLLCGRISKEDRITEREAKSLKDIQFRIWDI